MADVIKLVYLLNGSETWRASDFVLLIELYETVAELSAQYGLTSGQTLANTSHFRGW